MTYSVNEVELLFSHLPNFSSSFFWFHKQRKHNVNRVISIRCRKKEIFLQTYSLDAISQLRRHLPMIFNYTTIHLIKYHWLIWRNHFLIDLNNLNVFFVRHLISLRNSRDFLVFPKFELNFYFQDRNCFLWNKFQCILHSILVLQSQWEHRVKK